jgi:type II secretory pathway pseudopilin PulG
MTRLTPCLRPRRPTRGFLLLEMVLALAVFSIAATGFVVALHRMGNLASISQNELRITAILDSALEETISLPTLEEGKTTTQLDGPGVELITTIEPIEDLQNEEGQTLQEMFRIHILARWYESDGWQERTAETWRYGRMYQP